MTEDTLHNNSDTNALLPLRDPQSHIEGRDGFIRHLESNVQNVKKDVSRKRASRNRTHKSNGAGSYESVGKNLEGIQAWIETAYQFLKETKSPDLRLSYASEWLMDNFYLVTRASRLIKEDLSFGFYHDLPKIDGGSQDGYVRIFVVVANILAHQDLLFDSAVFEQMIIDLQKDVQFETGEIWAFPIFLRLSLLEYLADTLRILIKPTTKPSLPTPDRLIFTIEEASENSLNTDEEDSVGNRVANIIHSMRAISELDWNDFFESVSVLETLLRQDPAGIYAEMDFKTRDLYRDEVEKLARNSGYTEITLTEYLLTFARQFSAKEGVSEEKKDFHIGEFLIGKHRKSFVKEIGYRPRFKTVIKEWVLKHGKGVYLGAVLPLTLLLLAFLIYFLQLPQLIQSEVIPQANQTWNIARNLYGNPVMWIIGVLLGLIMCIPAFTMVTSLVNWIITLLIPPRILPKMDFKHRIPQCFSTMVVIPGMIGSRKDIDALVSQIEKHYLCNPEPGFQFAILTDFYDADEETVAEDAELIYYGQSKIAKLNKKYAQLPVEDQSSRSNGEASTDRFFFMHRKRLWNPSEGKWMGWERKRGKLHEFNRLIRGEQGHSYISLTDDFNQNPHQLDHIKYVITLDDDSILPIGAGKRLVGTMAHPLNRPVFSNDETVSSGYTILQPRMEIHPKSTNNSWFTRLFAGDTGLDIYTLAVSDTYMDLIGEGIYVGKGIYDVDAFERSINGYIPENTVLSHDLLEGIMGRAGLVTDITMVEDYPPNYMTTMRRKHRWIRGDWQLLPWLFKSKRKSHGFNCIDHWKIFDNLRRSLLSPALVFIFVVGLLFLPGLAGQLSLVLILSLGVPLFTSITQSAVQIIRGEKAGLALQPIGHTFVRWILSISFLIYDASISVDAILTTFYRRVVSHKNLLRWTTAAQTARPFTIHRRSNIAWEKMLFSALAALVLTIAAPLISFLATGSVPSSLFAAAGILLLWLLAPLVVYRIDRPIVEDSEPLSKDEIVLLRQVARRTWGFFERFAGPDDHWLPPDHFQETPDARIAHRTSPTNIGLLLTSILAAYDFGYLDHLSLTTRLNMTMKSMTQLERYRGHFFNWYDTLTQKALPPHYVSTVDSGNIAACLIVTSQACQNVPDEPFFRWELAQGYLDLLTTLAAVLSSIRSAEIREEIKTITTQISNMESEIHAVRSKPDQWYSIFIQIEEKFLPEISTQLLHVIDVSSKAFDEEDLTELEVINSQIHQYQQTIRYGIAELLPWLPLLREIPLQLQGTEFEVPLAELKENLPSSFALKDHQLVTERAIPFIRAFMNKLRLSQQEGKADMQTNPENSLEDWLNQLENAVLVSQKNALKTLNQYRKISEIADRFVKEMDFGFLYNHQKRFFHIGFSRDTGSLDTNYYNLLASEARIASLIAIAKREVPSSHWMYLGRPVTRVENIKTLISWSGTMFEYLLPSLFLRSYPGTLLADSNKGAVQHQIAYGKSKGVPWGISESGYYRFDAGNSYQYQAFGIPGLGFKRGLSNDLVIAPYASLIAVGIKPQAVVSNLHSLINLKMLGSYGLYESLDFTTSRLMMNQNSAIVKEYMAHHQGMLFIALANYLHNDIMVDRMHRDPRIQSVELLLQEQVPPVSALETIHKDEVQSIFDPKKNLSGIDPWNVPVVTSIPQVNLLSNGSFRVLISNRGTGYISWRDRDITRWQSDPILDNWGSWVYIRELNNSKKGGNALWSAAFQPSPVGGEEMQVAFHAHMVSFRRDVDQFVSVMEVTVSPDDPVEIRRIHLQNDSERSRRFQITSYGEVSLSTHADDAQHPAFNKLFIKSEYVQTLGLQIFSRRPRSSEESPLLMGHMLLGNNIELDVRHEADRRAFIGRGHGSHNPQALLSEEYLGGSSGATLDPIFSLGFEITLAPHDDTQIAFVTFVGESREALIALAEKFNSWVKIERTFHQADISSLTHLGREGIDADMLKDTLKILSALLYPYKDTRADAKILAANQLGQPALWRFGISGDFPILLVSLDNEEHLDIVRDALLVFKHLRSRGFKIDLVILNGQPTDYGAELNGLIHRLIRKTKSDDFLNLRGGIYVLFSDQMKYEEAILLQSVARVVLVGENGSLARQLPDYSVAIHHLPRFSPSLAPDIQQPIAMPSPDDLLFFNGYGGFSTDGTEYHILLESDKQTPAPWVNVIGYPDFGFMVTETGSQTTWAINSGENRLTPWFNDPVCDPTGEALYLRDEETGDVWSPTPQPGNDGQPYRIRHGAGYTIFEHQSHDIQHSLTLYASPSDPVKIIRLHLTNLSDRNRQITATQYVEWVLGTTRAKNNAFIIPEYDFETESLLASNPYNSEFHKRIAFLSASKAVHGMTADRTEFIGRAGTLTAPLALERLGLEHNISAGEDQCAVLQLHIDLPLESSEEIYFILGQGNDRSHAIELIQKYRQREAVERALEETHAYWNALLNTIEIETPDKAMNIMLNRWGLYQALSCRIWGRTAFYQSSGAYGARDQLQDVLALLSIQPQIARQQILRLAAHQFEEGDVLHWWHPPTGRGVRTRFSDDLLWLPYVTSQYIIVTGDSGILGEEIPFLQGELLAEGENDRYGLYQSGDHAFPLYEHCLRAIHKGSTQGVHGLPLIGGGDWNDGMNRVGEKGKGESVWLGWFLVDVLKRFADICDIRDEPAIAEEFRQRASKYAAAVEENAWDGAWYRRGYYDDGTPLGSHKNSEGKIDAIAQSWAVISKGGDKERSKTAMKSVLDRLVLPEDRLLLLFTPPFDKTDQNPGYIKGYLPGIRENGAQYTHAATWTAWAFCELRDGTRSGQLFNLLNPVYQADTAEKAETYLVEPYVITADIYSEEPYIRRGGWSWYTGSASWFYRLGIEEILGFTKIGDILRIDPVIPETWDSFRLTYRYEQSTYDITVENPKHRQSGVTQVVANGEIMPTNEIRLRKNSGDHTVTVVM